MTRDYPYTADDLRRIADQIDAALQVVGEDDLLEGDWRWGLTVDFRDDGGEIAGQLRPYGDGWLGFYPRALTKEDI